MTIGGKSMFDVDAATVVSDPVPASQPARLSPVPASHSVTLARILRGMRRRARKLARMRSAALDRMVARIAASVSARARHDPVRALAQTRRARRLFSRSRFLAEAEALFAARARLPEAPALIASLRSAGADLRGPSAAPLIGSGRPGPGLALAQPAQDRTVHLPQELAERIVVYTAVFGDMAPPAPLFQSVAGLRLVCLSDRAHAVPGWEILRIAAPDPDPRTAVAWCKILPHRALAEAGITVERSLYVAPDRIVAGNLHTLLTRWCAAQDLALWRHPAGSDWRDLLEHDLLHGRTDPAHLLARTDADLPQDAGAWDSGVLWRRHGSARITALMEAWWAARKTYAGADDLALYRAVHAQPAPSRDASPVTRLRPLPRAGRQDPPRALAGKQDPRALAGKQDPRAAAGRHDLRAEVVHVPAVMPAHLGPATDNLYFARRPASLSVPQASARIRRGPVPISFLYADLFATSASTFLRGQQLSAMVAAHYPDLFSVEYTSDTKGMRDRIVILTKGALKVLSPEELTRLRTRNIAVVGAWDDDIPDPDKARVLDAHLTLGIRQTLDLARAYPQVPAYFVTHHVNRQVPRVIPPTDRLRTGYFGTLDNTVRPASLASMVDLVGINTATVESSWLDALPDYNCHWIVRRRKPIDGWKPFLKGFVAARCRSAVIVQRDDDDVGYYLGDDYPFYVSSLEPETLEADMLDFTAAFGGPEWRMALEIMDQVAARSSEDQVCAEFKAMIDAIIC